MIPANEWNASVAVTHMNRLPGSAAITAALMRALPSRKADYFAFSATAKQIVILPVQAEGAS